MADLIDRDAVIAIIEDKQKALCPVGMFSRHAVYGDDRRTFDDWDEIIEAVSYIPTVDAVPVRRGRWIPHITEDGYKSGYDCSVCGVWLVMPNGLRKYCPDCGALMGEGEME